MQHSNLRARIRRLIFASALLTLTPSGIAQEIKQQRVLALYVTTPGTAAVAIYEGVDQRMFRDAFGTRFDLHSEFIEPPALQREWLLRRARRFPPLQVQTAPARRRIATSEASRQFAEQFRADLFPGTPIVFVGRTAASPPGPGTTGVSVDLDLAGTVDLALMVQPGTKHVFVIAAASEFDRIYERLAHEPLQRVSEQVSVNYLPRLAIADLEKAVAQLPPDSVICFLTLGEDGAGGRFRSTDALDRVAAVANPPAWSRR